MVTLVSAIACEFPRPANVADERGDFAIALDKTRVRIVEGLSASVGVKLSRDALTDAVTVTVGGLPAGVTAEVLRIDGDAGTLTLHAAFGATQGEATLTITATSSGRAHDAPLSLLAMGPPGTLDKTFGSGGMLSMPPGSNGDAIVIQPDGKVLVAGSTNMTGETDHMVARYLSDGAVDKSFSDGMEVLDQYLVAKAAIALQPDGNVLIAETLGHRSTQGMVVRLNAADGGRDSGFGDGGQTPIDLADPDAGSARSTVLHAVAVQPDGGIVVVGGAHVLINGLPTLQPVVARLTPSGTLDENFGTDGRTVVVLGTTNSAFLGLTQQPDGHLVAIGYASDGGAMVIARLDRDGNLDSRFANGGFVLVGLPLTLIGGASVVVQSNGGIIGAAGTSDGIGGNTYLVRLNGTFGSPDTDFGRDGIKVIELATNGPDFATGLALQSDGKFVVVGSVQTGGIPQALVARFETSASLDRNFGDGGIVAATTGTDSARFEALALDAEGRILATGFRRISPPELILYRFWP